jgi:membrane-associated PAP2 superfamily phosphatase
MSLPRRDLWVTGVALALLLLWDTSGLDLALVRAWGSADGFGWRDHWFTARVLHDGGRWLAGAVLAGLALNVWRPLFGNTLPRAERWRWLLVTLATLLLVPLLKSASLTSCPYELAEFGGPAAYVSHWRFGVGDGGPGRCFPSGHATSAVAFFYGWFALRERHRAAARGWLAAVCVLGALYGWAQMARGAHYPSHTLWSAWLCWTLALAASAVRRPAGVAATPP